MRYEVLVWTADKVRSAKLAVIISYPISSSKIIIIKNAHKSWITLPLFGRAHSVTIFVDDTKFLLSYKSKL